MFIADLNNFSYFFLKSNKFISPQLICLKCQYFTLLPDIYAIIFMIILISNTHGKSRLAQHLHFLYNRSQFGINKCKCLHISSHDYIFFWLCCCISHYRCQGIVTIWLENQAGFPLMKSVAKSGNVNSIVR